MIYHLNVTSFVQNIDDISKLKPTIERISSKTKMCKNSPEERNFTELYHFSRKENTLFAVRLYVHWNSLVKMTGRFPKFKDDIKCFIRYETISSVQTR